ncbi:probable alpha,alpha-trehalose-phosphate synthase [UDP-forming] 9 [Daucus carota subsp. sativus]|uniref:probable alpha,alpha-trehalose-phosphate synthase [UDP-forming] 9 n=1 Tax=Daucus carota subsp. sativus TaxID=79200 RepID=UPI003082F361
MAVFVFLRNKRYRAKLGFFLHSPVLASEIYRTLHVSADILRILLNYDLIGFHTFDFARHIFSCCSRMLGLDYESKRGQIGLDYSARTVYIKILPIGIHLEKVENVLNIPSTSVKVKEFEGKFKGNHVIVGVDDMNLFKAISLKLLASEQLLRKYENLRDIVVLVQIINPERSSGEDIEEVRWETYGTANRINQIYGSCGHQLVILIDRPVDQCRALQLWMKLGELCHILLETSVLIIYEYVGCSPSLSGTIGINPWGISFIAEAMRSTISMDDFLRQLRHEQNYSYVQSLDVAYWARSFIHSMERACLDHYNYQCWDFVGILVPHSSAKKNLSSEAETALITLCDDPKNTVFIVSGSGRSSLTEWLAPCEGLGLAAEHGYFIRWKKTSEWQSSLVVDLEWKATVKRKELSDHCKHVIANEPAVVRKGKNIVELKPQDASKGLVTEKVIATMVSNGEIPDFI